MRVAAKWKVPVRDLPKEFAAQFVELYRLCASSVRVRERTREWIKMMTEISVYGHGGWGAFRTPVRLR